MMSSPSVLSSKIHLIYSSLKYFSRISRSLAKFSSKISFSAILIISFADSSLYLEDKYCLLIRFSLYASISERKFVVAASYFLCAYFSFHLRIFDSTRSPYAERNACSAYFLVSLFALYALYNWNLNIPESSSSNTQ